MGWLAPLQRNTRVPGQLFRGPYLLAVDALITGSNLIALPLGVGTRRVIRGLPRACMIPRLLIASRRSHWQGRVSFLMACSGFFDLFAMSVGYQPWSSLHVLLLFRAL
jgi:hypothetical protein